MLLDFSNEPLTDFSQPANRTAMEKALDLVWRQSGQSYPLVINGQKIMTNELLKSINPANVDEVVGYVAKADLELAAQTVQAAEAAFTTWSQVEPSTRARYLFKAAAEMRRRKYKFSALLVYEVGKSWAEADADTAEAIDFMEFYGREMLRLAESQPLTRIPAEDNELYYIPLGVGVIIPPWNFPLAILVGMTTAAIVAGNTVVLKPASASPVIAAKFVQLMENIGLPPGVINFLPGSGEVIGDYLVDHPKTRFISFTGSMEVGRRIYERAAKPAPGQIWLKRVVAEMGGKDAVIVDKDADLNAAVDGIVASAFGFQGQKCSACSRAIIHQNVYDCVLEKVVEKTKQIKVGPPRDPGNFMGPVIDQQALEKILKYIEIGKQEARLASGGGKTEGKGKNAGNVHIAGKGYFIEPTVFANVDPKARIAQEEIFGPVVAFIKAGNFDHALAIANDTVYGLTGAVYSTNREHLEKARRLFHAGNLYFNRKCTGALVGVHPFGGFNLSGTDSKAGSRDYLLLFTQAKVVSEKL